LDISRRKRRILQEIISLYTLYGDPVGSRLLGELLDGVSVSSATIRNDMAELTALGLLEQPYTSAGRVPTVSGYRYYVDNLLRTTPLSDDEKQFIDGAIEGMDPDPNKSAELAARALVKLTRLAAIATTPRGGNIRITRFEMIRCGKYNIGIIGITGIGGIRSRVCRVQKELSAAQIEEISSILNRTLIFVSPEDVEPRLTQLKSEIGDDYALYHPVLSAAVSIIESLAEVRVFTEGQQYLLSYAELEGTLRPLMETLTDSEAVCRCIDDNDLMRVYVGDAFGIDRLGMVIGRYSAAGGRHGALAVTGPVRMDYGYVIPRLSYFLERLSAELTSPI